VDGAIRNPPPGAEVYSPSHHLGVVAAADRLVEPSFDNPDDHLEFNPEIPGYKSKTNIGRITNTRFFCRREVVEGWVKLSTFIRELVVEDISDAAIQALVALQGHSFVCAKFLAYWQAEKVQGRIQRPVPPA